MKKLFVLLIHLIAVSSVFAQQQRIASDFEIAQMKEQLARSSSFSAQISGHLNLGDLYLSRSQRSTALAEYRMARDIAAKERRESRRQSDLARYATATALGGLAAAKLGDEQQAFTLLEEAIRYSSSQAEAWNRYATAMTILRKPDKAVAAARNAVRIAEVTLAREASVANRLDAAVYRYSLASALIDAGKQDEAQRLLEQVTAALRGRELNALRSDVARRESFEIYSTARGDAAAYLSLLNRAQLRLATIYAKRGNDDAAREQYLRVLETRTDDADALAGLARLSRGSDDRERYFAAAFDANPFSLSLVREYQRFIEGSKPDIDETTAGGRMRAALVRLSRGETRAARTTLDDLLREFPGNDTLELLLRESESERAMPSLATADPNGNDLRTLVGLLRDDKLTADQQASLDRATFTSTVMFTSAKSDANGTVLESGTIADVRFRFTEPTIFAGNFPATTPLLLTYRILGATEVDGADGLLLEPLRLEPRK